MKKFLLSICLILSLGIQSCTDDSGKKPSDTLAPADVPAAVNSAFTAKYPGITDVKWEKATEDDKQTFKAEFKSGEKKMKAEFAADGSFVKEKTD